MINKQGLWFLTLFSLILVLSIYYVSMDDDKLANLMNQTSVVETDNTANVNAEITESSILVALRVDEEETVQKEVEQLETILLDDAATVEEKNDAYNSLTAIQSKKGKEAEIEKAIQENFNLSSFVKIKDNQVTVVASSVEHDTKLANEIIRKVQSFFDEKKYITVKFQG